MWERAREAIPIYQRAEVFLHLAILEQKYSRLSKQEPFIEILEDIYEKETIAIRSMLSRMESPKALKSIAKALVKSRFRDDELTISL